MTKQTLWTRNFLLITLVNFFLYFAFQMFPSALPPYLKTLGASDAILGWPQGILTIAILLIRPVAGMALDKRGRKGIFLWGILGMVVVTAAYHFFPVVGIILIIRFAHGLVWGIANTACSTIATDNIEKTRFTEGISYFSLTNGIAMALAPAVALSIGIQTSIWLGAAFLCVGFVLALFLHYQKTPAAPPQAEQKAARKKVAPYAKESILPSIIVFFVMITWGAVITFLALFGAERSIAHVGLFFTVFAVGQVVLRPVIGRLVDQRGFHAGIWPAVILTPVALLLLSISGNMGMLLICALLYGVGVGAAQSTLQAMAVVNVSKDRVGAANATYFTFFDGGIGVGAVIAGLLSPLLGYGGMFASMAICPVAAGILFFATAKKRTALKARTEETLEETIEINEGV
ncbi:MAG: MFS transporter [Oscillospiraceae bacterium]|nr:MFS transporter [Oscillospiraceae bacterium]